MNLNINGHNIVVGEDSTTIPGLLFKPQMHNFSNDEDWSFFTKGYSKEITPGNYQKVEELAKDRMAFGVMEIGVCNNGEGSFTYALLNNKPDSIPYLGVDIKDKSFLNDESKKIYTIQANSFEQERIREYMKQIKMKKIGILLIDGWHSLNAVINDWLYTDLLAKNGVVIFHDTNSHPGPTVFLHAIDSSKYHVEKYFENEEDFGLSAAFKL